MQHCGMQHSSGMTQATQEDTAAATLAEALVDASQVANVVSVEGGVVRGSGNVGRHVVAGWFLVVCFGCESSNHTGSHIGVTGAE